MDCKLVINCQYYENYNVGPDGFGEVPYWKPKGGHEFEIEVDSDVVMYSNKLEQHLTKLVEAESTIVEKFEYVSHELKWSEPSVLSTESLYELIRKEDEVAV
jgi:hypothetical protein